MILLGGLIPLGVAYSLGKLCFRRVPDVLALGAGAVIEAILVFCLLSAGIAHWPAFLALGALGLAPLAWLRPRPCLPLPRDLLLAAIFAGYGVFYLIHALAPEIQPDGLTYHLALVSDYARLGRFPHRIQFYVMQPQGVEMLFLFAFKIGGGPAAKLVDYGFLLATVPLMLEIGRRMGLSDRVSGAAAALYFCAPVTGLTGTSTYVDAAMVFFTLATLLALLLWKQEGGDSFLIAAGLAAGFCYAIKLSGALIPVFAAGFALTSRKLRPALIVAALAAIPMLPWIARGVLVTGDPVAPLGNAIFPNPYFHLPMELEITSYWRTYGGFSLRRAPWELTVGDKLQGTFGPVFLLAPIGLLALRRPAGRWIWLAALLAGIPWLSNAGARFLMPSIPFLALAMAMSLDSMARPALWACVAIHAIVCLPMVAPLYQPPAWRLPELPWRAALRLESEPDYLARTVWGYPLAALLRDHTRPNETTYTLLELPNAYIDRPTVEPWQSALADRLTDTLWAPAWAIDLRAAWPATNLHGLRFRLPDSDPHEWDVNEVNLFSGSDQVFTSPHWTLTAWPNPWEARLAFDGNLASRWRTWGPRRRGTFLEARFDRPQRLTSSTLVTHAPAYSDLRVEVYGLGENGSWRQLAPNLATSPRPSEDLRRAASRYVKQSGVDYLLAPAEGDGLGKLGRILVEQRKEYGLEDVAQWETIHLLRVPQ